MKHVVHYKTVFDELSIPQITECKNSDLDVKLFYKGSPIPLQDWSTETSDCKFKMLPNFSTYIQQESKR